MIASLPLKHTLAAIFENVSCRAADNLTKVNHQHFPQGETSAIRIGVLPRARGGGQDVILFSKDRTMMNQHVDMADVASFLLDIEDEFSPQRLRGYTNEVRPHLPKEVLADIEEACRQLVKVKQKIHQAAEQLVQ